MLPRSYLYVPADAADKVGRAGRWGADAVVLDLEDAVPNRAKQRARDNARRALSAPTSSIGESVWVRVDPAHLEDDLEAIATRQLSGVFVPKAEPELLLRVDEKLRDLEDRSRLPQGRLPVVALVETARGLLEAAGMARQPRVIRMGIGEVDLAAELKMLPDEARSELLAVRTQVVVASAAAGKPAPIGAVETRIGDRQRLEESTRALLRLGFRARSAVHPSQIGTINAVFSPSDAEIAKAQQILDTLALAERRDLGVGVDSNGEMVDAAVVRAARETLERAGQERR